MTTTTPPRIAFVGCGSHSTHNLYPALAYADCRLDAVCDLVPALAERNARLYGAPSWYTDVTRMLDERRPDGVFIVGAPSVHAAVGRQVLERGIPVYVEKPTAPSLAEAEAMVALARAKGTFVMTGYMKRFGLAYRHLQQLIRQGAFVPAMATIRYGHWRCDDLTNMLLFMSVHPIDLARALLGPVERVTSHTHRLANQGLSVALTLRHASGAITNLVLDSAMPRIQERVEISGLLNGANALAIVDNVQHLELHQGEGGVDVLVPTMDQIEPTFALPNIQIWRPDYAIPNMGQTRLFFQGFAGAVREFVNAIRDHRDCVPSPEEALDAMRIIDGVVRCPDGSFALAPATTSMPARMGARA